MKYEIQIMRLELASKIGAFLSGQLAEKELKSYAWDQDQTWEKINDDSLPPHSEDDRVYWSAIWDIINFNDNPPEYHPTIDDLKLHLKSLRGEITLPPHHVAFRPCRGVAKSKAYKEWEQKQTKDKMRRLP